ncbi:MAG: response regulator, partial [Chloroflexi bacterium]|nr:response regulator [Chloroflexota bacterium]
PQPQPLSADLRHSQLGLDYLLPQALRAVVATVFAAALLLFVYLGLSDWGDPRLWRVILLLLATAAAAGIASRRGTRLSSALVVGGLLYTLADALHLFPGSLLAVLSCLIVLIAGVLRGWRWGFLVALIATAIVVRNVPAAAGTLSTQITVLALILLWTSLLLSWLISRPSSVALDWAWNSYEQALRKTEEARTRQGELAQLSKSLNEAYNRLEQMNQELERARRAAEEARRLKAEFAANISHELRTPLNLIIGFSEMMVMAPHTYEGEVLPPSHRGDVEAIYRNAQHLSSLIDDVLDLSQIEAGRMGLNKERVALEEVIREAVSTVWGMFEKRGLYLQVDAPAGLPTPYVDRTRVRQIVINLLGNAARFTERGGVRVAARQRERELLISVADTGIGIRPEDLPNLFEEFYQVESSIRRRYGGSGLGLTVSKKFTELHGGSMWAESQPGAGSTFFFTLPLSDNVAVATLRADWETWAQVEPSADQPSLVVVDGDPGVQRIFQRYLDGYRVVVASDLGEATAAVESARAQAIIAVSPESENGEGEHVATYLRGLPPRVPLALCTLQTGLAPYQRLGVAECLLKPISRDRLLQSLTRLNRRLQNILVVDDDPEMVRLIALMIRSARRRCRVGRAYSGAEALLAMRTRRPDVVVLDLLMPEMDGDAVLERMRADESLRDIPVVVITAHGGPSDAVTARSLTITREDGLSVGELMRCLKTSLDSLLAPDSGPAPPAASAE